jgi:hypothetical protein
LYLLYAVKIPICVGHTRPPSGVTVLKGALQFMYINIRDLKYVQGVSDKSED